MASSGVAPKAPHHSHVEAPELVQCSRSHQSRPEKLLPQPAGDTAQDSDGLRILKNFQMGKLGYGKELPGSLSFTLRLHGVV